MNPRPFPISCLLTVSWRVVRGSALFGELYFLVFRFRLNFGKGRRKKTEMDLKRVFFLQATVFVLIAALVTADPFISGGVLQGGGSISRSLLQAKTSCPLNFEFMDYKIITNKCKGPQYRPDPCCSALKEFACPYTEQLNDLTNDCATTMFSYINLYGKYPPGLFAYECHEGKEGLDCSTYINKLDNSTSSANMIQSLSPVIGTVLGVTVALLVY